MNGLIMFSGIIAFVSALLSLVLFIKIWIATDNITTIKNQLSHLRHVRDSLNHILNYMLLKDGMTIAKHPTEASKMVFVEEKQNIKKPVAKPAAWETGKAGLVRR